MCNGRFGRVLLGLGLRGLRGLAPTPLEVVPRRRRRAEPAHDEAGEDAEAVEVAAVEVLTIFFEKCY